MLLQHLQTAELIEKFAIPFDKSKGPVGARALALKYLLENHQEVNRGNLVDAEYVRYLCDTFISEFPKLAEIFGELGMSILEMCVKLSETIEKFKADTIIGKGYKIVKEKGGKYRRIPEDILHERPDSANSKEVIDLVESIREEMESLSELSYTKLDEGCIIVTGEIK